MNRKGIIIGLIMTLALGGGVAWRLFHSTTGSGGGSPHTEAGHTEKDPHGTGKEEHGEEDHHEEHGEEKRVVMQAEVQKRSGIVVAEATRRRLPGNISATGRVEANSDRVAHVSPRISGKLVSVASSLGESVAAGQVLATIDSVELGEALGRYHQSRTRLALAQSSLERIKGLVEKKIAPRKDILQAETDWRLAQSELHADEERLLLYGLPASELQKEKQGRPLLPVRSPISGVIIEKHAIVGELADPSKNLFTVADLSSAWVMVDIHEKDLARVRRGQPAEVMVGAFAGSVFRGRITHLSDMVDEATRTVKARVEVTNHGRRLKPGMFATVRLPSADDAPPVLAVPEDALQELDGRKILFVAESDTEFAVRPVEVGRTSGGMVEVVSGLEEGERYVAKGTFTLKAEIRKGEIQGHQH